MIVKFWGVRGSIPTPNTTEHIKDKIRNILKELSLSSISSPLKIEEYLNNQSVINTGVVGGNTSCVELRVDSKLFIFDMGSGIKRLGNYLVKKEQNKNGLEIHIFLSHTHWDHIMGFPFFIPAFFPSNKIFFYSPHPNLKERMEVQQDFRFFPVSLNHMSAKKEFIQLEHNSEIQIGNVKIKNIPLYHPGGSFGYRVEHNDKIFVYATDSEYKDLSKDSTKHNLEFFKDADLLVFDAQYTFEEAVHKEDWGHSSALVGIDFSIQAGIKKLALFHHEPDRDDYEIYDILKKSLNYKKINYPNSKLEVFLATEGLEIEL